MTYGIGKVYGYEYSENIYLPSAQGQPSIGAKMNFLGIFKANDIEGIRSDGLIGLSPLPPSSKDSVLSKHLFIS